MNKKFWTLLALLLGHSSCFADSSPVEELKKWLSANASDRMPLAELSFSNQPISKADAEAASQLLLKDFQDSIRRNHKDEWKNKSIKLGEMTMKFDYRVFGEKPMNGRRLFISMHGGGGTRPEVNDGQWRNQIRLYQPAEGVYLAPRAPTDTWNLWHQGHIDSFFERIIEDAIVFEDVDPNKVYIMGYSAGGDGVYQLAPRMADSLAAAAMMAGHPNDASPLGLRNIGFTLHMGGKDSAYNRNGVARQWKTKLAELQKNDPKGYKHEVVIREKYGHWMNGEDKVAVPWMSKFTRNPLPNKVVWRQASTVHDRFYWLAAAKDQRKNGSLVVAELEGNRVNVSKMDNVSRVMVRFNDEMLNMDKAVEVTGPDGKSQKVKLKRTIGTIYKCLSERVDPKAIFFGELEVAINKED